MTFILRLVTTAAALALAACGGGKSAGSLSTQQSSTVIAKSAAIESDAGSLVTSGSQQLPSAGTLQAKASNGEAPSPVFRFFNRQTGVHFFTISSTEAEGVKTNLPQYTYEGAAFYALGNPADGLLPVYRFANLRTGTHLYTISESEKNNVIATLSGLFRFEGVGWYAKQSPAAGWTPIYRLRNQVTGSHFYTASATERDQILASSLPFFYEGLAYYVHGGGPYPGQQPHTGITASQCFGADSDVLQSCDASNNNVNALYTQQDGHQVARNPMSYRLVNNTVGGGSFPITSCVQDVTTGLMWEGKEASGPRAGDRLITQLQSASYVYEVNSQRLCGFNDWRVPDVEELQGIVDYSKAWPDPMVNTAWFPNTLAERHWTSSSDQYSNYWVVSFRNKTDQTTGMLTQSTSQPYALRLVRGPKWTRERFAVQSATYPSDTDANVVMDLRTGLRWRRCLEGQQWVNSTCSGTPLWYTQNLAMVHAQSRTGWRIPNIKELASLSQATGNNILGLESLFPNASHMPHWSTTPYTATDGGAWSTEFAFGWSFGVLRNSSLVVRLVKSD